MMSDNNYIANGICAALRAKATLLHTDFHYMGYVSLAWTWNIPQSVVLEHTPSGDGDLLVRTPVGSLLGLPFIIRHSTATSSSFTVDCMMWNSSWDQGACTRHPSSVIDSPTRGSRSAISEPTIRVGRGASWNSAETTNIPTLHNPILPLKTTALKGSQRGQQGMVHYYII